MDPIWISYQRKYLNKRRKYRLFLLCFFIVAALLGLTCKTFYPSVLAFVNAYSSGENGAIQEPDHIFTWTIAPGDTLNAIFERHGIGHDVMLEILSADESLLVLDVLTPGHMLTFNLDQETRELASMELFIHPGNRVVYKRVDDTHFEYEEIITPGKWRREFLHSDISSSLYLSARRAGLTDQETGNIANIFRSRVQFARDIRDGDCFQVIRRRQFVGEEFTGQSHIEGVRIFRGKSIYSAFLFDDGNYYDEQGKSLANAFLRYPMRGDYRITSHFSKARRHPITHRIAPHNGVDFAMPPGTPVLSTGNGVVIRVHKHPFAGKYVEIQHGSRYASRYLHLNRILVRRGQAVKRGARIALSGNTGRSTGPHLHYELHAGGRPVNPLTAKIPTASAVPKEKLAEFKQRVRELLAMMEHPSQKIALYRGGENS